MKAPHFAYLHEVEERRFIVEDVGEVDLSPRQDVNLVLTVVLRLQEPNKVSASQADDI